MRRPAYCRPLTAALSLCIVYIAVTALTRHATRPAVLVPENWPSSLPGADGDDTSWIVGMHREPLWSQAQTGACGTTTPCPLGKAILSVNLPSFP